MRRILNIGSINIDHVYQVPHFALPGETIAASSLSHFPGGKGLNQSIALARAGSDVFHAGRTGPDGTWLIDLMRDEGIDVSFVDSSSGMTGHAIIQVNGEGENSIILFAGANHELARPQIDGILSRFGSDDCLVLQNEVNDIAYIMEEAHKIGMRIVFNPSPLTDGIKNYPLGLVGCFILNDIEGRELSGMGEPEMILDEMKRKFPKAAIVLTLGKNGVLYRDLGPTLSHGVYDVEVVDTTAAGDTFTGFFLSAIAADKPADEALRIASVAASIAVSRKGASSSIPTLREVRQNRCRPLF
jgi:ribokinase